jgi:phosphoenolpyruvate-protein phosphotransferase
MIRIRFKFPLANGLHARPASLLQEACQRFAVSVVFCNQRNGKRADVRSALELVASDTLAHDPCSLEISGRQEKEAALALNAFLRQELPHADDDTPMPDAPQKGAPWLSPVFHEKGVGCFQGRALAPGTGTARGELLHRARSLPKRFAAGEKDGKKELQLFEKACKEVENELRTAAAGARNRNAAAILNAHLAMVVDPGYRARITGLIEKKKMPAGAAIEKVSALFVRILKRSTSVYLRERAVDLGDIAVRLGEKLYRKSATSPSPGANGPRVILAEELSPSELLALDRRGLRGLVLGDVGATSHSAILARSLAIPTVSLPARILGQIKAGEVLIVDGGRGLVVQKPGPALKRYYRLEAGLLRRLARRRAALKMRPAQTRDRRRIEIAANVGSAAELEPAWKNGAEAIGLFRSEILFLERDTPPGEDEQYDVYRRAVRSARGRTVIIRTLDVGGDKRLPYLALPPEENPYLGYRAVRFYGEYGELIRCQLRAILRAAAHGPLKIMVPMVSTGAEISLVRSLLAEAAAELRARQTPYAPGLEIGIMVETPAAALSLESLAREADFFSVGSNDLLQYFLAVDRNHPKLEGLYDPLHPAFLRLLEGLAARARSAKRWLGICGEMAGNPDFLPLLVGAGFDELSMASQRIPAVKERLGELDGSECRSLLRRAGRCPDAGEVRRLLAEFNGRGNTSAIISAGCISLDSPGRTIGEAIKELCGLLELYGRVSDASALEEAVWKREATFATDLGFGFALPHGKSSAVRASAIAFLRPRRPIKWGSNKELPVRAVLLIAIPENGRGQEHLRLIARLSRQLMHEDFRGELLAAVDKETVLKVLRRCLQEAGAAEKSDMSKEKNK